MQAHTNQPPSSDGSSVASILARRKPCDTSSCALLEIAGQPLIGATLTLVVPVFAARHSASGKLPFAAIVQSEEDATALVQHNST